MALLLKEIISRFEQEISLAYQELWDRSGLQVGSLKEKIKTVLFAYDASHEVVRHAVRKKANLVVTHHPLQLKDYKNIDLDTYEGETIRLAVQNNFAIYSAHTSHDSSPFSLNRHFAKKLGLTDLRPLVPLASRPFLKLIVFVPKTHTNKVLDALFSAGAGHIGRYSSCSFRTTGTGTFKGDKTTSPFLGEPEKLEEAMEERVEVILPRNSLSPVINEMLKAHPYEEVAYDIVPLENPYPNIGSGLVGKLSKTVEMHRLIPIIKKIWGIQRARLSGRLNQKIQTIALCTGSGASLLDKAVSSGADLFITGDVKYHAGVVALRNDICLLDIGHFYSEIASVSLLKNIFQRLFGNELKLLDYRALKDVFQEI